MSNLFLKEWIVNQSSIFLSIAIILLASVFLSDGQVPMYFAILIGCIYPFSSSFTDTTNKSDILINSLPVKPKEIVSSKYIFSLLVGLFAVIMVAAINALLPFLKNNELVELAIGLSAIGLFIALYYPLFYLLGPRFITYAMIAFFIFWFAIYPIILNTMVKHDFWGLSGLSTSQLSVSSLGITIAVLVISWYISGRVYQIKRL